MHISKTPESSFPPAATTLRRIREKAKSRRDVASLSGGPAPHVFLANQTLAPPFGGFLGGRFVMSTTSAPLP